MADDLDRSFLPQVMDDLRSLAEDDETLVDIALQAVTDIAARRKTGKVLGARHVSGDLTGSRRLKFDLEGQRPERFRVVYRPLPDEHSAETLEVISIGRRGGHAVYAAAATRLGT